MGRCRPDTVVPSDTSVRPLLVVDVEPGADHHLSLEDAVELLAVEHLVAHRAVEALDEGILLRARLLDEDRLDTARPQPVDHRRRDELAAVVRAGSFGCPVLIEKLLEETDDVPGPDGAGDVGP